MNDEAKQAGTFVKRQIEWLAEGKNESAAKATLAKLRRGIGKAPGSMPELWEATLDGLPEALISKGEEPTSGEWAVHTALTLYALHQQGKDSKKQCMSRKGESLGISLQDLIESEEDERRIKRRFDAAATSDSLEEISHHLRGLIQLLKNKDIPLDYPALTADLYWFQLPAARDSVRLRWGQDFYRLRRSEENGNKK